MLCVSSAAERTAVCCRSRPLLSFALRHFTCRTALSFMCHPSAIGSRLTYMFWYVSRPHSMRLSLSVVPPTHHPPTIRMSLFWSCRMRIFVIILFGHKCGRSLTLGWVLSCVYSLFALPCVTIPLPRYYSRVSCDLASHVGWTPFSFFLHVGLPTGFSLCPPL